ncbi:MAG: LPS assembly lipoprotein LptE [Planctomycetota bacterium]
MRSTLRFLFSLVLPYSFYGMLAGGCSYTTQRPFPTDIQTVHVEMFQSKEFRRELEFRLTEAVGKRLEMDTPYRLGTRETADALLSGEILEVKNRTFADDFKTDLPREIGSTVILRVRFQDLRTGETLVERPRFVYQSSYIPPVGETFSDGMTRAMDGLAEVVVEAIETDW